MQTTAFPAPTETAQNQATAVVEVVGFRLIAGCDPARFAKAARGTETQLRNMAGFRRRRLVQAGDGMWTDWVEWTDLDAAHAAAQSVVAAPEFAPFLAMIDPDSVTMRHDAVIVAMD
jgi:hypothetical protein